MIPPRSAGPGLGAALILGLANSTGASLGLDVLRVPFAGNTLYLATREDPAFRC